MTKDEQIEFFIKNNSKETIQDFNDKLYENLKDLNSKEARYISWMAIIIVLYLVAKASSIDSLQLGFISFNDSSLILKLLPLLFIYYLYTFTIAQNHRNDVYYVFQKLAAIVYLEEEKFDSGFESFTRIVSPYSFAIGLGKLVEGPVVKFENNGIFKLFLLPIFLYALIPYLFIIYCIVDMWQNSDNSLLSISVIILAIYLLSMHIMIAIVGVLKEKNIKKRVKLPTTDN